MKNRITAGFVALLASLALVFGPAQLASASTTMSTQAGQEAAAAKLTSGQIVQRTRDNKVKSLPTGACTAYADQATFGTEEADLWNLTSVVCNAPMGMTLVKLDRTIVYDDAPIVHRPVLPWPVSGRWYTAVAHTQCSIAEIVVGTVKNGHMTASAVFATPDGRRCITEYVTVYYKGIC